MQELSPVQIAVDRWFDSESSVMIEQLAAAMNKTPVYKSYAVMICTAITLAQRNPELANLILHETMRSEDKAACELVAGCADLIESMVNKALGVSK